jgi:hypothetical protein
VSHRSSSPHQVDGDKSVYRIKDEVRRSGTAVEAKLGRRLDVLERQRAAAAAERAS